MEMATMFANFDHLSDETDFQFPLPLSSATTAATTTTPAASRLFPMKPKPSSNTFPTLNPSLPNNSTNASLASQVRQGSDPRSNNSTLSSIDSEHLINSKDNSVMDHNQEKDNFCDDSEVAGYRDGLALKPLAQPQLDTFTLFEDSMRLLVDIHGLRNSLVMEAASTADSLNTTLNQIRTSLLRTSACSDHDDKDIT